MIKNAVHENEIIYGMQRELQSEDKKQGMQNLVKAADYLQSAMEILEETGLSSHADKILNILLKIAQDNQDAKNVSDSHTKGLTPERMVENLKHHGIVFNLADDHKANDLLEADVSEEPLEVTESHPVEKDFEEES